jgi:hypothetical protein
VEFTHLRDGRFPATIGLYKLDAKGSRHGQL